MIQLFDFTEQLAWEETPSGAGSGADHRGEEGGVKPYIERGRARLWVGDVRDVLRSLPAKSVHTVVTSPPYWGLRDYGVDGQLGLEETPDQYIENMVQVFLEVRRVMRSDATLWLNIGDSYSGSGKGQGGKGTTSAKQLTNHGSYHGGLSRLDTGCKPKDLVGIPWMMAFALRGAGYYLRSDIIWSKPNPMPESVTDRPTKAHEYLFLLSKSATYFYDQEAIREPHGYNRWGDSREVDASVVDAAYNGQVGKTSILRAGKINPFPNGGRNRRTVWEIPTEPFPAAHFATYPTALVEPCIKAGTSERGCCSVCGAPWRRVVERGALVAMCPRGRADYTPVKHDSRGLSMASNRNDDGHMPGRGYAKETLGWQPSCSHDAEPSPCIVLDPFAGSGTTLAVAQQLGRIGWGIELNREYADLAGRTRLAQEVLPL